MTVNYPNQNYYDEIKNYLKDISVGDYFYHFKKDPASSVDMNAYKIIGFATDTASEPEQLLVLYTPIYRKADVSYFPKSTCASRPIHNFFEMMNRGEYQGPRFIKITDPETIKQLNQFEPTLPVEENV